jgi:hypothetical protein
LVTRAARPYPGYSKRKIPGGFWQSGFWLDDFFGPSVFAQSGHFDGFVGFDGAGIFTRAAADSQFESVHDACQSVLVARAMAAVVARPTPVNMFIP